MKINENPIIAVCNDKTSAPLRPSPKIICFIVKIVV